MGCAHSKPGEFPAASHIVWGVWGGDKTGGGRGHQFHQGINSGFLTGSIPSLPLSYSRSKSHQAAPWQATPKSSGLNAPPKASVSWAIPRFKSKTANGPSSSTSRNRMAGRTRAPIRCSGSRVPTCAHLCPPVPTCAHLCSLHRDLVGP